MKVAFATSDHATVDQQFRRASRLAVYEVGADGHRLLGTHSFPPDRAIKTRERMKAIDGVSVVYGVAFLPSTVARLRQGGIRAATAPAGTPIASLLAELERQEGA
jgi:predicted Fe-Mo cluster-binding NifX family protein